VSCRRIFASSRARPRPRLFSSIVVDDLERIMTNSTRGPEGDLDFAERMVRKGFGTPEQAAQVCGVSLADLQARLGRPAEPPQNGEKPES
jgi:hypothetical protein